MVSISSTFAEELWVENLAIKRSENVQSVNGFVVSFGSLKEDSDQRMP